MKPSALKLRLVNGMRFSETQYGEDFVEVRIRMPSSKHPSEFRGSVEGNAARKRFIAFILGTASGMVDQTHPGLDLALRQCAAICLQSADDEFDGRSNPKPDFGVS